MNTRRKALADLFAEHPDKLRALRANTEARYQEGRIDVATYRSFGTIARLTPPFPVLRLSGDAYDALCDVPYEVGPSPRLPFSSLTVQLPPGKGLTLSRAPPGTRPGTTLDDVVLTEWPDDPDTWVLVPYSLEQAGEWEPLVGDQSTVSARDPVRSDSHLPNVRIQRVLINLFHLLQDRQLQTTEIRPTVPKSPKKLKRLERRGLTTRPYTLISLTKPDSPRHESTPTGRTVTAHIRRGHWCRYWVLDADDRRVLATMLTERGKTLHCIAKWIRPCVVGKGEPRRREYRVTL